MQGNRLLGEEQVGGNWSRMVARCAAYAAAASPVSPGSSPHHHAIVKYRMPSGPLPNTSSIAASPRLNATAAFEPASIRSFLNPPANESAQPPFAALRPRWRRGRECSYPRPCGNDPVPACPGERPPRERRLVTGLRLRVLGLDRRFRIHRVLLPGRQRAL